MPSESLSLNVNFFCGIGNGCMRAETVSHNVVLYRIPFDYAQLLDSKRKADKQGYTEIQFRKYQKELKMAGIYILIDTEKNSVYIGKADSRTIGKGLIHRMLEDHKRRWNPIRWDIGFALTSKTEDLLSQNELSHLEWLFYHKAKNSGQYTVSNGQIPSGLKTESAKADAEEKLGSFIRDALNILSCQAGCNVFIRKRGKRKESALSPSEHIETTSRKNKKETVVKPNDSRKGKTEKNNTVMQNMSVLHMGSRGAIAYGYKDPKDPQGKRFIVRAGSKLASGINECLKRNKPGYYKRRIDLEKNGVDKNLVLLADEEFRSVSEAACVIGGDSLNGLRVWKEIKKTT